MAAFDRILGILLALQGQHETTAPDLARRFEVSTRTIYRDLQTLSGLGVPVYAERGRGGGVRLLEGYFLPPLMFARDEAVALLLGQTLLRGLRAAPLATAASTAREKLLAALPTPLRAQLTQAEQMLGVERIQADIFHPEMTADAPEPMSVTESAVVTTFLLARLNGEQVSLCYHSPYTERTTESRLQPLGLFWDRERWYLVGQQIASGDERIWRADRVLEIASQPTAESAPPDFDIRDKLDHAWLRKAMAHWRKNAPVHIHITNAQAERLQQDWYYRHASYAPLPNDRQLMTIGESDPAVVLALLRWLGPGAELVSPPAWRALLRSELQQMLTCYEDDG